jgi:hypothetical protein|tara:strand:+ start:1111 stop:1335 length:225 start_codon:yes stop_codon:yes gene_type:complete
MINWIKNLFTETTAIDTKIEAANQAPYKVEAKSWEDTSDIAIAQRPAPAVKKAATKAKDTVKKPATRGRKPKTK